MKRILLALACAAFGLGLGATSASADPDFVPPSDAGGIGWATTSEAQSTRDNQDQGGGLQPEPFKVWGEDGGNLDAKGAGQYAPPWSAFPPPGVG